MLQAPDAVLRDIIHNLFSELGPCHVRGAVVGAVEAHVVQAMELFTIILR